MITALVEDNASAEILPRGVFFTVFIKESDAGVHRHEYSHHIATSHSTL
jgi:hypothetical protein